MARYTGPMTRKSRRLKVDLVGGDQAFERRPYPPGQHGRIRIKETEYLLQVQEKLRTTFDKLPAGVSFTTIMDCCHSGTNTRAILPPDAKVKQRYLPSPWGLAAAETGRSLPKKVTSELRRSSRSARKAKDIVNAELPELLITGCRDTQTSADAFINGRYNGALTFALVEAIRKTKGRLTYRQLHDRAAEVLKARKFEQVPQLEGRTSRFDAPLFSA